MIVIFVLWYRDAILLTRVNRKKANLFFAFSVFSLFFPLMHSDSTFLLGKRVGVFVVPLRCDKVYLHHLFCYT